MANHFFWSNIGTSFWKMVKYSSAPMLHQSLCTASLLTTFSSCLPILKMIVSHITSLIIMCREISMSIMLLLGCFQLEKEEITSCLSQLILTRSSSFSSLVYELLETVPYMNHGSSSWEVWCCNQNRSQHGILWPNSGYHGSTGE